MSCPNITGSFDSRINNSGTYAGMIVGASGFFKFTKFYKNSGAVGYLMSNASHEGVDRTEVSGVRSSSVFGKSSTVQPLSTRVLCIVRT